jgi:rsbT antagonist protein RsbS
LSVADERVVLQPIGGLLLVPIQGPVHDAMFQSLTDSVLTHLRTHGTRGVVLDLAGVDVLDAHDFDRLRRVVEASTLMGAPVVIAGMRPGVAAGLTMLDVDARWVRPVRTIEHALAALR